MSSWPLFEFQGLRGAFTSESRDPVLAWRPSLVHGGCDADAGGGYAVRRVGGHVGRERLAFNLDGASFLMDSDRLAQSIPPKSRRPATAEGGTRFPQIEAISPLFRTNGNLFSSRAESADRAAL